MTANSGQAIEMRALALPLFPEPLPFRRPRIPGFDVGDLVRFGPLLERKGRVIATLPHFNALVLRSDDHRIVEIEPQRVRKI